LLELIDRIGKAGAAFRSLGDPLWDSSSSQGRLLSTLLAAICEFERDLIRERTLKAAGATTVYREKVSGVRADRPRNRDFLLIWIIGYFWWIIGGFCGVDLIFGCEEVLDIGFVDSPEAFFDALALLRDQLFRLARQICASSWPLKS
jgi:hypothetical protein